MYLVTKIGYFFETTNKNDETFMFFYIFRRVVSANTTWSAAKVNV